MGSVTVDSQNYYNLQFKGIQQRNINNDYENSFFEFGLVQLAAQGLCDTLSPSQLPGRRQVCV